MHLSFGLFRMTGPGQARYEATRIGGAFDHLHLNGCMGDDQSTDSNVFPLDTKAVRSFALVDGLAADKIMCCWDRLTRGAKARLPLIQLASKIT
jgi:hypothetical protein